MKFFFKRSSPGAEHAGLRHRRRRTIRETCVEREVHPLPPRLSPSRAFPPAKKLRKADFFAGACSSRAAEGPIEPDLQRNVDSFCAPKGCPHKLDLPPPRHGSECVTIT